MPQLRLTVNIWHRELHIVQNLAFWGQILPIGLWGEPGLLGGSGTAVGFGAFVLFGSGEGGGRRAIVTGTPPASSLAALLKYTCLVTVPRGPLKSARDRSHEQCW